ncbi:MAG: hypothetical protein LBT80_01675 [Lactobacillaceae bacterium]|jgi:hypothetical protein|nr:hypothetical protein [Lactobacillaceae bacterium]
MLEFNLRRIPTLNEYINAERIHRIKASRMKRDATTHCQLAVERQYSGEPLPEVPHRVIFRYFTKDMRTDLDNISSMVHKAVFDGMQKAMVDDVPFLKRDGLKYIAAHTDEFVGVDKENPRVEVEWEIL